MIDPDTFTSGHCDVVRPHSFDRNYYAQWAASFIFNIFAFPFGIFSAFGLDSNHFPLRVKTTRSVWMASNTAVVFTKIMEGLKAVYSEARIHESMQRDNPIPLDQVLKLR